MPFGVWMKLEGDRVVGHVPRFGKVADKVLQISPEGDEAGVYHAVQFELVAAVDHVAVVDERGVRFAAPAAGGAGIEAQAHLGLRRRSRGGRIEEGGDHRRPEAKRGCPFGELPAREASRRGGCKEPVSY